MEPVEVLEAAIPVAPDPALPASAIYERMTVPALGVGEVMGLLREWHDIGMLERTVVDEAALYRWGEEGHLKPEIAQTKSGLALQRAWR